MNRLLLLFAFLFSASMASAQIDFDREQECFIQRAGQDLTESTPTSVVRLGIAQGKTGGAVITWVVTASDGTDYQAVTGVSLLQVVNKAGAETCVSATTGGTDEAVSSSTLAYENAPSCATAAADTVDFYLDMVSGLTQTSLKVYYRVCTVGDVGTVQPQ